MRLARMHYTHAFGFGFQQQPYCEIPCSTQVVAIRMVAINALYMYPRRMKMLDAKVMILQLLYLPQA